MQHLLSVDDMSEDFILEVWTNALKNKDNISNTLSGKILTNLFYEASTRTSSSFFSAMTRRGGSVIPINNVKFSSVTKGETLEDTIIAMSTLSDCIVLRHPETGSVFRAASVSSVPIINARMSRRGIQQYITVALDDKIKNIKVKKTAEIEDV